MLKLNYQTREVSTTEIYDAFNPPLVFTVKSRAANGWRDNVIAVENSDMTDVKSAIRAINALCLSVTDGEERYTLNTVEAVETFHQMLSDSAGADVANEAFCYLAHGLGINQLDYITNRIAELKKMSLRSDNGKQKKTKAKAS